jgi:Cys-tRNA synthase (O-phospho-L-seryl-tRNA:Cys-tRNA synthase)
LLTKTWMSIEEAFRHMNEPAGIMTISQALDSDDPLSNIMNELSGRNKEQRLFRDVFGAILDINSAGPSILWDRISFSEVDQLLEYLNEIEALKTRGAIMEMREFIVSRLGDRPDEDELFDFVMSDEFENIARPHDLKYESMVDEMEERLLEFAEANSA